MDLHTIAFHEAGHALAAERQNIKLKSVSIVPKGNSGGRIEHQDILRGIRLDCDGSDRARMRAEKLVLLSLAGPAAQRRFDPNSPWEECAAADHAQAGDIAMMLNSSEESVCAYMRWMEIRADDLVAAHWPMIEYLADLLMEQKAIAGEAAMQLIKERRLAEILRQNSGRKLVELPEYDKASRNE